MFDLQVGRYNL